MRAQQRQEIRQQRVQQREERIQQRAQQRQERAPQIQQQAQQPTVNRAQQQAQERRQIRELQAQQRRELRTKGVSRGERLRLQAQQRQQLQDLRAQQLQNRERARQPDQLRAQQPDQRRPQLAGQPRQERSVLREQARKDRAQRREQRLQRLQAQGQLQSGDRAARITREQALQGRFAARFQAGADRRAVRTARILARQAWRAGRRAGFVAWVGPVFYPYAYSDIFDYTFFPYAYDEGYWAYAYDDFFESVFWAYGSPYSEFAYYPPDGTTGSAPGGHLRRETQRTIEQVCEPARGVTAWPFGQIERATRLTGEQKALLDEVRKAAAEAATAFKSSCQTDFAMTPPGRLQAMISRLEATLEAVGIVRPPLEAFYNSLSDEQKARFNEIGPNIGQDQARAARNRPQDQQAKACREPKPGLTNLPIEQIDEIVRPNAEQRDALERLNTSTIQAVEALQAACPDVIALTPVGRLETMEKRLQAMLDAAETVQPALEDFYAALSNEQKARFNTLGRQAQRAN